VLFDEFLGGFGEELEHVLVDVFEVADDLSRRCLDHVFRLRNADSFELDASLVFDLLDQIDGLLGVEGDAGA